MTGRIASRYDILGKVGEGGMGEVYKARDVELDRHVALKFLSSRRVATPQDVARLLQEARAISALNHPHIATIYGLEEAEGRRFLVLEFLPGGTLKAHIRAQYGGGRKLDVEHIVGYALQMAEGLAHAHRHGIVHRDFKADNVMLTEEGAWKITDFGIAKLHGPSPGTHERTLSGTPAYMSPEQARGEEVDHRSDVFSFGIVLYFLATGELPYQHAEIPELLRKILEDPPPSLRAARPDVPAELEHIVNRCLEKRPEDRYPYMTEAARDLKALAKALESGGADARPAIAVLPFRDLSPQQDNAYFCEGMAEDIIHALTRIEKLRVASHSSTSGFRGGEDDVRKIGTRLKVGTVLEGSVRKAGDRLRVTAALTNVADGYQLWSERYDREARDVFAIQDEIARAIAERLRVKLLAPEVKSIGSRRTERLEAYHLYLKGRYYWNKRTAEGLQKAIQYFQQALAEEPDYAPAWAGLADTYVILAPLMGAPAWEVMPKARDAALKALQLDETLAEAHASLGAVKAIYDWDWTGAQTEFFRAFELNPGYGIAHHWHAMYCLEPLGEYEQALREMKTALECDPLSLVINASYAITLAFARQFDAAIEQCRRTLELEPAFYLAHWAMGLTYAQMNRVEEALRVFEHTRALVSVPFGPLLGQLGYSYARLGRREDALNMLAQLDELSRHGYISAFHRATTYLGLGDLDRAAEFLDKAAEERYIYLLWVRFPVFDPLRSHPRFAALMKKLRVDDESNRTMTLTGLM